MSEEALPSIEPPDFIQVGNDSPSHLRVYIRHHLYKAVEDFALRDTSREQAGLLLGQVHEGPDGPFVTAEQAMELGVGEGEGRFSERSWSRARRLGRQRHPHLKEVGWFHTHPGTGLEVSGEERDIHRRNFSKPWQVLYVVDPVLRERTFHAWKDQDLTLCEGFRIYGKEDRVVTSSEQPPVRPDEQHRERYLERSLEKIQKMLKSPAPQAKDYIQIGLLVLILLVLLLRPQGAVSVDTSELAASQERVAEHVAVVSDRVHKIEQHLRAMQIIDEELAIAVEEETPAEATPSPAETPEAAASPPAAPETGKAPELPDAGAKVRLHKVGEGDTLSTICEKYYQTADPKLVSALGRFNKLQPPNYDLWPGDTVKIPSRQALGG